MSVYKRGQIWWVRFEFNGKKYRESSRSRVRRVAEEYEWKLRDELARQYRGGRPNHTFDEMMARFIREHLPTIKPSSARRYIVSIKALQPHFEGWPVLEITRGSLNDFIAERRKEVTTTTIRRDLACLSSAFRCAINWEWVDYNPVQAVDKRGVKESPPRTRYLTEDEYQALVFHAGDHLKPMIKFAVATGMRLEEQLSMTWDQVNLADNEIYIPVTKTGTPRTIPIPGPARLVLKQLPIHIHSPHVFCKKNGTRYGKMTRGLEGAAKRAGIKDLRWHDLRRTFGSWMLQSGVDIHTVGRWLGHKSSAVTERAYAFMNTENLHRAAQKQAQSTRIEKRKKAGKPQK